MDIASLGLSLDSSQAGQAATNLDRLVQSANNAQQAQQKLSGSSAALEAQMRQMVAIGQQQIVLLDQIVRAQGLLVEKTTVSTTAMGAFGRATESSGKSLGTLSAAMSGYTDATAKAFAATEKLTAAVKTGGGSGLGSGLASLSKEFEDLKRLTGESSDQILSIASAMGRLKLTTDEKATGFAKLNQILSDTSDSTKAYKDRIEGYIGTLKGLSSGEVTAKLVTALNQTADSAQKTSDAFQLLGIRGADGLKRLAESGAQVVTETTKQIDAINKEVLKRSSDTIDQILAKYKAAGRDLLGNKISEEVSERVDGKTVKRTQTIVSDDALRKQIEGDLQKLQEYNGTVYKAGTHWAEGYRTTMYDFGKVSEETAAKLNLIYSAADRIRAGADRGGLFGWVRGMIADLQAVNKVRQDIDSLYAGTYKPSFDATPFGKAESWDMMNGTGTPSQVQNTRVVSPEDLIGGQRFMAQFSPATAAVLKFNDTQKQANDLFAKGVINAQDLATAIAEAGTAYTRATGNISPFIEQLKRQRQETDVDPFLGEATARRASLAALEADLVEARKKQQEWATLLSGVLPGGTRTLVRRRDNDAKAVVEDLGWKAIFDQLAADAADASARTAQAINEWQDGIRDSRVPEFVRQQTEAYEEQAAQIDRTTAALDRYGAAGDAAATREQAIFAQVKQVSGNAAAADFLDSGKVPEKLDAWVVALDKVTEANQRLRASRTAMDEEREASKLQMTADAYEKGGVAIAQNERAMKLLTIANSLGFDSFEKLTAAMPNYAARINDASAATNNMRLVVDQMKRSVEAANAAADARGVAGLGVAPPAMIEEFRVRQEFDRRRKDMTDRFAPGDPNNPNHESPGYGQAMSSMDSELKDRLDLQDSNRVAGRYANQYQKQLSVDIATANRRLATAGPNANSRQVAITEFVTNDLLVDAKNTEDLAKARKVLAGDTSVLDEAERKRLKTFLDLAGAQRGAEVDRYAEGLDIATEAAKRLADAEGQGAAAMRAAQAQNRIAAAGEQDVGGLAAAKELENEIIEISRIVAQYEGQATQAAAVGEKFALAIAAGATSAQEFSVIQERHNIALQIGTQITGDSAEMEDKRRQAIEAANAALDKRILIEGKNQGSQQLAAAQQQLTQLVEYNAALTAGGTALAEHADKVDKNNLALNLFKTTYEKLPADAQALVDELRKVNVELETQRKVTQAINDLRKDQDDLAYLEKEVELIGKSRREREITLQTMRLEQQLARETAGLNEDAAQKIRDAYAQRAELIPQTVDKKLVKEDMEKEAQAWTDIWKNATLGIQNSFAGFFDSVLSGGTKTWSSLAESLKRVMFQVISQIAAAMIFKPVIGSVLGSLGASRDFMSSIGMGSYAQGAGSSGIPSTPGFSLFGGGGASPFQGILDTPLWGSAVGSNVLPIGVEAAQGSVGAITGAGSVGMFTSEAAMAGSGFATGSGAAAAPFTIGSAMPAVGAGLSIFNAVQNPNVGTIAGAAATTFGAAATMFPAMFGSLAALGPYGMIAGAVLSILGNTLFKKKPSNLGAESSFTFSQLEAGAELDFSRLYRGDKHPGSLSLVDQIASTGQDTLNDLADQYEGVRFGGTISARYGRKEGSSISYGAPDAQTVDDWQVFKFDAENEEETAQAFVDFAYAALKSADWSGLGETVASAVSNSTADNLEDFLADVDFAKAFDRTVEYLNNGLDPVNSQLAQIRTNAETTGENVRKTVDDFLKKTEELWPPVVRMYNEAGEEITATTETVTQSLTLSMGSLTPASQEVDSALTSANATLVDASGAVYEFSGTIGDATLQVTDASGEILVATYDASTGMYELATSITTLSDTVVTEITELSTQGQQGSLAAKNYVLAMAGVNDSFRYVVENGVEVLKQGAFEVVQPLTGLALALETSRNGIEALRPAFEAAGYSAEQIATVFTVAFAQAEQDIRATFARMEQANAFYWTSQFNPEAIPTVGEVFSSVGADLNKTPNFRDEINSFLLRAGSGVATQADYQGLSDNFTWQGANSLLTPQQLSGIKSMVDAAFQANLRRQNTANQPANDNGGSSGYTPGTGGGGGGGSTDTSEQQKLLREQISALNENASEARNLANSFGRLSVQLLDYRKSLLLGPLTPLTPLEQYNEAKRQFEDALTRANSSDKEISLKGMQDLQGASGTFLEKSRAYWASSTNYQADFDKVQKELLLVGNKAKTIEEQQLAVLANIETQLVDLNEQIAALQQSSNNGGGGGTVTTPGGDVPSTNYDPGKYPYADKGILFGVGGLGRALTENTETFMKRRFDTSLYGGPYDEQSALNWMQGMHGSGATRNQYYAAATKTGYTGKFGGAGGGHTAFLNADKSGQEWAEFIAELRKYTTVNPGAYRAQMAEGMPSWIYEFNQGGITVGGNVLPFTRPNRGGDIARAPTLMGLMGGRAGVVGEHRDEAILPLVRTASGDMGVQTSGGEGGSAAASEIRRVIAQNGAAYSEVIHLLRVMAQRLEDVDNSIRRAA